MPRRSGLSSDISDALDRLSKLSPSSSERSHLEAMLSTFFHRMTEKQRKWYISLMNCPQEPAVEGISQEDLLEEKKRKRARPRRNHKSRTAA